MSDDPLSRDDDGTYVILLSPSAVETTRVLNSYGLEIEADRIVPVMSREDAELAAITYASDTKWCCAVDIRGDLIPAYEVLRDAFGMPSTQSDAFQSQNREYAINPKAFKP